LKFKKQGKNRQKGVRKMTINLIILQAQGSQRTKEERKEG